MASMSVSKTVDKSSSLLVGAIWLYGVMDSTKHYGCFGLGSNPNGATIGLVRSWRPMGLQILRS